MSERALEFVELWVSEHITPASDPSQAKALAAGCLQAAKADGIPQAEVEEAFDDLAGFIAGEIAEAKEREGKTPTSEEEIAETVAREAHDLTLDEEIEEADEREAPGPRSPNK
jgi:hypothetical protein